MLWFIFHNIIKQIPSIDTQTKNLFVFLIGVTVYTFLYSWVGSLSKNDGSFLYFFFNFFSYIILADGFSMAIIYKNYFSRSIFNEVKDTFGTSKDENTFGTSKDENTYKTTKDNIVNNTNLPKNVSSQPINNKVDICDDELSEYEE
jgi:predicted membrane protein